MGGGLLRLKNGLIMKNINAIILLSSLTSASVFAGAYVENREAYNLASDQGEVMLRVGYNFDMGAGIMLTNTYTFSEKMNSNMAIMKLKVGILYLNLPIN